MKEAQIQLEFCFMDDPKPEQKDPPKDENERDPNPPKNDPEKKGSLIQCQM